MKRCIDTNKFNRRKAGETESTLIEAPYSEEDRDLMSTLFCGEVSIAIKQALEDKTISSVKHLSDGYHTFKELYDMRLALTIALFHTINTDNINNGHTRGLWRSKLHQDNTMYEGMFIVGMTDKVKEKGVGVKVSYITFHYDIQYWDKFDFCDTLPNSPTYDGHTDKDVIERLLNL